MSLFDGQPLTEAEVRTAMSRRRCAECNDRYDTHLGDSLSEAHFGGACHVAGCRCPKFVEPEP